VTRSRIRARNGFSSGTSRDDGSGDCVSPSGFSGNSGSNPLVAFASRGRATDRRAPCLRTEYLAGLRDVVPIDGDSRDDLTDVVLFVFVQVYVACGFAMRVAANGSTSPASSIRAAVRET